MDAEIIENYFKNLTIRKISRQASPPGACCGRKLFAFLSQTILKRRKEV